MTAAGFVYWVSNTGGVSTSMVLLALLESGPAHGYTLKQGYDELFPGGKPLAFGQVYSSLARFEKHGLACVLGVEAGGGPDRKRYRITPEGVEVVTDWVQTAQVPGVFAGSSLLARVAVTVRSGRDPQRVLDVQRESHLERIRELGIDRPLRDVDLLAVSYELAHLEADLQWIEHTGERLAVEGLP